MCLIDLFSTIFVLTTKYSSCNICDLETTTFVPLYYLPNAEVNHDDIIKWKHFPRYGPFVRESVNSPHKGQSRGALMFSLICAWINGCVNHRGAGYLRHDRTHYDVTVMNKVKGNVLCSLTDIKSDSLLFALGMHEVILNTNVVMCTTISRQYFTFGENWLSRSPN